MGIRCCTFHKMSFRIPRLAQNLERFHENVVEESLLGKDVDGTEDMRDPRTSSASVTSKRHRNEICVSLKRSSIIYNVYLGPTLYKPFSAVTV